MIVFQSLTLSNAARKKREVGEIVNLISVDVSRVQEAANFLYFGLACPLFLLEVMYFLWQLVGPSSLAGLGVLLFVLPFTSIFPSHKYKGLQVGCCNLSYFIVLYFLKSCIVKFPILLCCTVVFMIANVFV